MNKTPLKGLEILETLHKTHPKNQSIKNSLINAYIKFGYHDVALEMISNIPENKIDVQNLRFRAWQFHKQGDIHKEENIWNMIFQIQPNLALDATIHTLIQRSKQKIKITKSDITLLCKVFNEAHNLLFYLQYYRRLGVSQFFFIDNNSTDGSFEFLLKQNDCHVFWTNDSHVQSGAGTIWINALMQKYCVEGSWIIYADADEFLVYPHSETIQLSQLIKYLNKNNYNLLNSFMLDIMYT